jgi:heme oxygenase
MERTAIAPAHSLLRRSTLRLHRRIDGKSKLAILVAPGVTLQLYSSAMEGLAGAYSGIDTLFLKNSDLCPAGVPPYVPRTPSLNRDLAALGRLDASPVRQRDDAVLPAPANQAAYLGMRYVVEGAQLGSRLIYRHLQEVFGDRLQAYGSFWAADLTFLAAWPGVLAALSGLESRQSLAAAARAARFTFRHMERHLALQEIDAE